MTRRQEIIEMLQHRKLTFKELCDEFLANPEDITDDLRAITGAIKPQLSLEMTQPQCNSCGFIFKDRLDKNKVRPPTKCPKCDAQDIKVGKYYIERHTENIPKAWRDM